MKILLIIGAIIVVIVVILSVRKGKKNDEINIIKKPPLKGW